MSDTPPPTGTPPASGPPAPPPPSPDPRNRILWALGGLVAVLVLITVAVVTTRGDDGDDLTTGPDDDTTTTTAPPSSADDGGVPDTTTSTTTTTEPPTTTTEAPTTTTTVRPASAHVVVADGYLLGYHDPAGDAWVSLADDDATGPDELPPSPVTGGETFRFLSADGEDRTQPLGPVGEGCYLGNNRAVADDTIIGLVGVPAGGPDPLPRPVSPVAIEPVHVSDVAEWLQGQGAQDAEPKVDRVLRFDRDGDGRDEFLIEGSDRTEESFSDEPGAYSVILYRYVDAEDRVRTVEVAGDVVTEDEVGTELSLTFVFRTLAVADLTGDGLFEVVTRSTYYEGESVEVLDVVGDTFGAVLQTGCGA